ncbi:hypothetical protein [Brachybacterium sp. GPGPB12]|uniref:hypothetical protein n=1 Tax=Brachybacterium sp. GPGPB12 TaxID=3023517 RepID=UPI0031345F33
MATTETRLPVRTGISGAAPAPRMQASGKTFTRVTGIFLIVAAILWLIPSLFAIKTSLTDNGVAALGAQEILTDLSPTLESYVALLCGRVTSGTGTSPASLPRSSPRR